MLVSDTRAKKNPWRLYATLTRALTSDAGHGLPEAVVFRDEEGELHVFRDQREEIWLDETGATAVIVRWAADKGILMQPGKQPMYKNERYTATISWQLESE